MSHALQKQETITGTGNTLTTYGVSNLDSSGGAGSGTLGDPPAGTGGRGNTKMIIMSAAGNNFDVTITHHETADSEVARFDAVDEYLYLIWTGTEWATISNTCTFP